MMCFESEDLCKMFDNIGEKLCGLATFVCIVGIIASIVGGLLLFEISFLMGLIVMLVGGIGSWISSWATYALGEIAINTRVIAESCQNAGAPTTVKTPSVYKSTVNESALSLSDKIKEINRNQTKSTNVKCPHCGETVTSGKCDMCGLENRLFK